MKTKNYEFSFEFWYFLWDCAFPIRINLEYFSHDFTEIQLQILCFNFNFTRISHKYSEKLDSFFKGLGNG